MLHLQRHAWPKRPLLSQQAVRHQSRLRQFNADVYDAERRGVLRAPPSSHVLPALWRLKQLLHFYANGISLRFSRLSTKDKLVAESPEYYRTQAYDHFPPMEKSQFSLFVLTFPLSPVLLPAYKIPVSCRLPAQADRADAMMAELRATRTWPTLAELVSARNMLRNIDLGQDPESPDEEEFWIQHGDVLKSLCGGILRTRSIEMGPFGALVPAERYIGANFSLIEHVDRLLLEDDLDRLDDVTLQCILEDRGLRADGLSKKERKAILRWWLYDPKGPTMQQMMDKALSFMISHPLSQ